MPPLANGEDRAFFDVVKRNGGVIRLATDPYLHAAEQSAAGTIATSLPFAVAWERGAATQPTLSLGAVDHDWLHREVERLEARVDRLRKAHQQLAGWTGLAC